MLPFTLDPSWLALIAASLFGSSMITTRNGLEYLSSSTGVTISVLTTTLIYLALAPWQMPAQPWALPAFWIFVVTGLIHPMLSMSLSMESTRRLGPTVSATVSSISPLLSAAGAVLFLKEAPSINIVLGTVAVVAGVMALSWQGGAGMRSWLNPAILLPLATAGVRGGVHVIAKVGMQLTPIPFMAVFTSYMVSSVGLVSINAKRGKLPASWRNVGFFWFVLTGFITGGALIFMYSAFSTGEVVVVSPIISSYPVFTLLWMLVLRPRDVLSLRILLGVACTVGGVMLIHSR